MKNLIGFKKVKLGDVINKIPNRDEWTFDRFIGGEHFDEGEIRVTKSAPIEGNEEVIGSAFHMRFNPGHVLYVTRNPRLRKGGIVDFEGVCSNVSFVLEADEKHLIQSLLPFIIQTEEFVKHTCNNAHGSTNPFLNWKDIAKYEFLLQPLEEQKKISELLWCVETTYSSCVIYMEKLIKFNKILLETLLIKLHTDNNTEWKKLSDIVKKNKPIKYGIVQAGPNVPEGVPYIKSSNIKNGKIYCDLLERTSTQIHEKYKRSEVQPGDIIFSLRGNLGETAIVPEKLIKANLTQGTARISCGDEIINKYLIYALKTRKVRKRIEGVSKGTTFLEISLEELREIKIPLLKLPEQKKVIAILDKFEFDLDKLSHYSKSLKNLRNKLSNELLSGNLRLD
jgi:type I restriction enzyme S subunit